MQVRQQCTFRVTRMLREVPEQSKPGLLINTRVAQNLADETPNLPPDNPSARR